jgi:hypothetical protein
MGSILSFFSAGLVISLLVGFFLQSFFAAGLFNCQRKYIVAFSFPEFFRAGAKNFLSFLIISLIAKRRHRFAKSSSPPEKRSIL